MPLVSYPRRLRDLAAAGPDRPAVTCGDDTITRAQLELRADRLARELAADGVGPGDMVTIALPNSVDWFVAVVATWKLGAVPQPVSSRLPERELAAIVELADPPVVLGVGEGTFPGRTCRPSVSAGTEPAGEAGLDEPLADRTSPAWKAPTSGGSTGRPKLILTGAPASLDDEAAPALMIRRDGCLVMPGPLYHNGPIVWSCGALLHGNHVVLLPRFDAEQTLAAIERHRADIVYLVPTMMKRIWRLPVDDRERYDLSSLRVVWHLAEPCPPWLKDGWIEWLGPDRIIELYGGTEAQTATMITGHEWLEHRGSVGRPAPGTIMIADDDGAEVPAGTQGEVWMRSAGEQPTYRYIGAEARTMEGGWESLGDVGWLDEDGYLHLGDRMTDMILTGGSNVYPAEVESALHEHPAVRSCAVIGLPDDDLGQRVHAIVEPEPTHENGSRPEIDVAELLAFLGARLVRYKVPRSIEIVDHPLRDDAGKVRRGALRSERVDGAPR
ncbi:MAG: AMP-binding protein [Acidimicrobiales bacterium]